MDKVEPKDVIKAMFPKMNRHERRKMAAELRTKHVKFD